MKNIHNSDINKTHIKSVIITLLISLYFFSSPLEFVLNTISPIGPPMKFLGGTIILFLILHSYKERISIKISSVQVTLSLWCFLVLLSFYWSPSDETAMIYFSSYMNVIIFFVVLTIFNYSKKQIDIFLNAAMYGSTLAAVLMLSSLTLYHGSGIRYSFNVLGSEMDPNNAAAFLLYGVVISLYKTLYKKNKKLLNTLILLVNISALFFTGSRGGFLAIIISILILLFGYLKDNNNARSLYVKILQVASVIIIIIWTILYFIPQELKDRILNIEGYETGSNRILIWDTALSEISIQPIFGYGIGSFLELSKGYFGQLTGMHNTYLTALFETGLAGMFLFLAFLLIILFRLIKARNYFAIAIIAVSLVPSFFLDAMVKRFFWNGLIIGTIMLKYNSDIKKKSNSKNTQIKSSEWVKK